MAKRPLVLLAINGSFPHDFFFEQTVDFGSIVLGMVRSAIDKDRHLVQPSGLRIPIKDGIKLITLLPSIDGVQHFSDGFSMDGTRAYELLDGTKGLIGGASFAFRPTASTSVPSWEWAITRVQGGPFALGLYIPRSCALNRMASLFDPEQVSQNVEELYLLCNNRQANGCCKSPTRAHSN